LQLGNARKERISGEADSKNESEFGVWSSNHFSMGEASEPGTRGTQATVLVVEDDPSLRLLCRVNLELESYRVLEGETIDRAEEQLRAEHVDVVLLDLHVGDRHGFELLPILHEQYPNTGICLLSGTSEQDPPTEEGVMFIRKPFDLAVLSRTVRMLVAGEPATP
jgi:DNA-binding NtrC family response regulator